MNNRDNQKQSFNEQPENRKRNSSSDQFSASKKILPSSPRKKEKTFKVAQQAYTVEIF
jgi:hypothetical protein